MNPIMLAQTKQELENCYLVLKELRPHLSLENFHQFYNQAHQNESYQIVYILKENEIVALMGYRRITDFVRGPHLYIDDLVTKEGCRSNGYGALLLQYAERIAKEKSLKSLRLCTGLENLAGIKFYEREGWTQRAFAYVKKLK